MTPENVLAVFSHWQIIMDHKRAKMDVVRARVIRERMRDGYTVEDLCLAIDGCAASAFHMGENRDRTVYDSITLILRDADHVDKFIKAGETAHKLIEQREERREKEAISLVPPTQEQVEKVRHMLKAVRLRRVA
jgi:hypothetical protein